MADGWREGVRGMKIKDARYKKTARACRHLFNFCDPKSDNSGDSDSGSGSGSGRRRRRRRRRRQLRARVGDARLAGRRQATGHSTGPELPPLAAFGPIYMCRGSSTAGSVGQQSSIVAKEPRMILGRGVRPSSCPQTCGPSLPQLAFSLDHQLSRHPCQAARCQGPELAAQTRRDSATHQ